MELLKLMSDRYTCRRYSEKDVKEEDLNKILEAGRVAPTSHNNQPQRIYVVKSEEAKEKFIHNLKLTVFINKTSVENGEPPEYSSPLWDKEETD